MCEKVTGNKIKFKKDAKSSIYDIPYFITDNSKVIKSYNWEPRRNILNIVKDTYNWLQNNRLNLIKYF